MSQSVASRPRSPDPVRCGWHLPAVPAPALSCMSRPALASTLALPWHSASPGSQRSPVHHGRPDSQAVLRQCQAPLLCRCHSPRHRGRTNSLRFSGLLRQERVQGRPGKPFDPSPPRVCPAARTQRERRERGITRETGETRETQAVVRKGKALSPELGSDDNPRAAPRKSETAPGIAPSPRRQSPRSVGLLPGKLPSHGTPTSQGDAKSLI